LALSREIRPLTGLRGVAALYVVFYHYLSGVPMTSYPSILLGHGDLAVDLFFMLSGFVMALNYSHMFAERWTLRSYLLFLGRRIARVYPLYLVATVCGMVCLLFGWANMTSHLSHGTVFLANLFMVQTWGIAPSLDTAAWSISAEWAAYLVFPLLLVPTLFLRPKWAWLTAFICVVSLCLVVHAAPTDPKQPMHIIDPPFGLPVWRCLPEFAMGLLSYRVASGRFGQRLGASAWASPVLCAAVLLLLGVLYADLAVVALFPLLLISLASGNSLPARLLSSPVAMFLGTLSYGIYIVHQLMTPLMIWLHARLAAHGTAHPQTIAAAAGLALTCPLAYAGYRWIELPGRRWLRHIFEGKSLARVSAELAPQTGSVPS
jgi:peptidoglycan/LPS O-acetylase OafA/YrhL